MRVRVLTITVVLACAARAFGEPVAARMHNVIFHVADGVELNVADLSGRIQPRSPAKLPVFDDLNSYVLEIDSARMSMTPVSLTNLLNNHVFADPGAPLKNLKLSIDGDELVESGTLKKGVNVPFTMRGRIGVTPEGKIRIHPTAMKAAGFLDKKVLHFFGLELDRLVNLKRTPAVTVEGDDLLLDPENLLPPPRIRGRLTNAWIEKGVIVEQFGSPTAKPAVSPPYHRTSNYMYYRGGRLRFGKLTMENTDLMLVDADSNDPFDFSPEKYNDQLVAGYSKNTREHGLVVFMPDLKSLQAN
jgi:hypothetical protein